MSFIISVNSISLKNILFYELYEYFQRLRLTTKLLAYYQKYFFHVDFYHELVIRQ